MEYMYQDFLHSIVAPWLLSLWVDPRVTPPQLGLHKQVLSPHSACSNSFPNLVPTKVPSSEKTALSLPSLLLIPNFVLFLHRTGTTENVKYQFGNAIADLFLIVIAGCCVNALVTLLQC